MSDLSLNYEIYVKYHLNYHKSPSWFQITTSTQQFYQRCDKEQRTTQPSNISQHFEWLLIAYADLCSLWEDCKFVSVHYSGRHASTFADISQLMGTSDHWQIEYRYFMAVTHGRWCCVIWAGDKLTNKRDDFIASHQTMYLYSYVGISSYHCSYLKCNWLLYHVFYSAIKVTIPLC